MQSPSITVVIPTRNRVEPLIRCLEQLVPYVRNESGCEIIVSDDGDAQQTAAKLGAGLADVRVVQGPQRGPAANRNYGASQGTGDLIVFLDDDCLPEKDLIAVYRQASVEHEEIGVFEGRISAIGTAAGFADSSPVNETGGSLWSCNFAVRRKVFEAIGGFDERYPFPAMEDVDIRVRLLKVAKIRFQQNARVHHPYELRVGWRVVQHHALSLLLYLQIHGVAATRLNARYFVKNALRLLRSNLLNAHGPNRWKHLRQLWFVVWENVQAMRVLRARPDDKAIYRRLYTPCCDKCEQLLARLESTAKNY